MTRSNNALVVTLRGGLGSQLFAVYAGYVLAKVTERPLIFDITRLEQDLVEHDRGVLDIGLPGDGVIRDQVSTYRRARAIKRNVIGEAHWLSGVFKKMQKISGIGLDAEPPLDHSVLDLGKLLELGHTETLLGFFPSWEIAHEARRLGLPRMDKPSNPGVQCQETRHRIESNASAAVHIRRGDFLRYRSKFGELGPAYFEAAFKQALGRGPINEVLCFSDAPQEASEILKAAKVPFHLADPGLTLSASETLYCMSGSPVQIGSNSSLSWHAAFWGNNEVQVFVPDPRYPDSNNQHELYPEAWTRIPSQYFCT